MLYFACHTNHYTQQSRYPRCRSINSRYPVDTENQTLTFYTAYVIIANKTPVARHLTGEIDHSLPVQSVEVAALHGLLILERRTRREHAVDGATLLPVTLPLPQQTQRPEGEAGARETGYLGMIPKCSIYTA